MWIVDVHGWTHWLKLLGWSGVSMCISIGYLLVDPLVFSFHKQISIRIHGFTICFFFFDFDSDMFGCVVVQLWLIYCIFIGVFLFNRENLYASSILAMVSANLVQAASLTTPWEFLRTISLHHLQLMPLCDVCWGHHQELLH